MALPEFRICHILWAGSESLVLPTDRGKVESKFNLFMPEADWVEKGENGEVAEEKGGPAATVVDV